jgi:hypothetical protein
MSAQQFEHDGFNSPNEVEVAKRAALRTPPAYSPENPAPLRRDGESIADYRIRCGWDAAVHDLVAALRPFAAFACSPPGQCNCHNCRARDVIAQALGGTS